MGWNSISMIWQESIRTCLLVVIVIS